MVVVRFSLDILAYTTITEPSGAQARLPVAYLDLIENSSSTVQFHSYSTVHLAKNLLVTKAGQN